MGRVVKDSRSYRPCLECGKDIYPDRKAAKARIKAILAAQPGQHENMRVYPGCWDGYHVGHHHPVQRGANLNDPRLRFI